MLTPGANTARTLVPAGAHAARCYSVIDLGTQEVEFNGKIKAARKARLTWEIPSETVEWEGKARPMAISKTFTLSMHEKATLRAFLKSWRGRDFNAEELKGFDLTKVIGASCLLNIIHEEKNGKNYANIASIGPLPKGMAIDKAVNPPFAYGITDGFSGEKWEKLSDFTRETIQKSKEYQAAFNGHVAEAPQDDGPGPEAVVDDVPF